MNPGGKHARPPRDPPRRGAYGWFGGGGRQGLHVVEVIVQAGLLQQRQGLGHEIVLRRVVPEVDGEVDRLLEHLDDVGAWQGGQACAPPQARFSLTGSIPLMNIIK